MFLIARYRLFFRQERQMSNAPLIVIVNYSAQGNAWVYTLPTAFCIYAYTFYQEYYPYYFCPANKEYN
jgi:hypothetical protein